MNKHGILNLVILSLTICIINTQFSNGADATVKQGKSSKSSNGIPKKGGGSLSGLRDVIKGALQTMDPEELNGKQDMKELLKKVTDKMDWSALGIKGLDSTMIDMALTMQEMQKNNPEAFTSTADQDEQEDSDFSELPDLSNLPDFSLLHEQLELMEKLNLVQKPKSKPNESKSESKSKTESKTKPKVQTQSEKTKKAPPKMPNLDILPQLGKIVPDLDMAPLLQLGNMMKGDKDSPANPMAGINSIVEAGQTLMQVRREGKGTVCFSKLGYSVSMTIQDMELCTQRFPFVCYDPDLHTTCNIALMKKQKEERMARARKVIKALGKAMQSVSSFNLPKMSASVNNINIPQMPSFNLPI